MASGDAGDNPPPITSESLPPIEERLADLRPSRQLLEFYRQKIAEYDDEYQELLKRFETLNASQEDMIKMETDLRGREAEIHQLQKALSDIQVFLMQEREHVVRLYSENDRLKLQQFEDSKKIQALLAFMGGKNAGSREPGEVTYFHREPPSRAIVEEVNLLHDEVGRERELRPNVLLPSDLDPNKAPSKKTRSARNKPTATLSTEAEPENGTESEVMRLKIKALQAQLEEVTRTSREQIDVLTEDRRVAREESDARVDKAEERMEAMRVKHDRVQELLRQTTQDLLTEKQNHRAAERQWMLEKDRLLRDLEEARDRGYESDGIDENELDPTVDGNLGPRQADVVIGSCPDLATASCRVAGERGPRDADSTAAKLTADHSAQTLIPSLGTLPPRPTRSTQRLSGRGLSSRSVRVADSVLEQREKQHQLEIEALQNQLIQANKLSEMYRDQVIGVESELSRLREEDSLNRTVYKERSDSMAQRLKQMKDRHAALERRRLLEAEGYRTDIRLLRNRLKDAEKQIYKLTVSLPVADGDDMAILKEVKAGSARAKKAQGEVNLLKAKVYGLEHQLRRL